MEVMRLASAGADQAVHAFEQFFPGFRMDARSGRRVRFELEVHDAPGLTMMDFRIEGPRLRTAGDGAGFAATQSVVVGEISRGRDVIDTSRPYLYSEPAQMVASQVHSRAFLFAPEEIRRYAREDLGNGSFVLDPRQLGVVPLDRAAVWTRISSHAVDLFSTGALDNPLIAHTFVAHMMAVYLHVFPTNWTEARRLHDGASAVPASMRRAKAFIEEHYADPVTVADIAGAARMSIRGLEAAFRRQFGTTPSGYLRRVRLAAARQFLRDSDPASGDTVAEAARAAGFAHTSRFAAAYREAFGELPGQTLRG